MVINVSRKYSFEILKERIVKSFYLGNLNIKLINIIIKKEIE